MSDAERIKRFLEDGHQRNREIFENLIELRGAFRANITSELCNIRLYMTALQPCTCFPNISEVIMQSGVALSAVLCKEHGWDIHEVIADIDMMFKARALEK